VEELVTSVLQLVAVSRPRIRTSPLVTFGVLFMNEFSVWMN